MKSRIGTKEDNYILEYFDELNAPKPEKERRIRLAKEIARKMDAFFIEWLLLILMGTFLGAIADGALADELFDYYIMVATGAMEGLFDSEKNYKKIIPTDDKEVIEKAHRFSHYIVETTEKAFKSAVGNDRFDMSRDMGTRIHEDDVPETVLNTLSPRRAVEIAVNESGWIFNYINHQDLVKRGNKTHTWETMRDEKVRIAHAEADGQTVLIDKPFIVGGYPLLFPGDDSLGAPVELTINCRCLEI